MKHIKVLFVGIFFGIVLTKAEVISWYRIYEMFRFESFHMYGIIGSAIVLGIISTRIIKIFQLRDFNGNPILLPEKGDTKLKPLLGGAIFGLGWALTGACPGPIYIIIGNGYLVYIVVLLSAILGTLSYGMIRDRLPQW
jgi:hypothetical protein